MTAPYYPPAPKPKRKKWPWIVGGVVFVGVVSSCISNSETSKPVAQTSLPPSSSISAPVPVQSVPSTEPVPTQESVPEVYVIGDGTHIVGTDIELGTYRSSGAQPGLFEFCMWTTKSGASSNSDMIDLGSANVNEQQVVEITEDVLAFESNGCEEWEKVN